MAAVTGRGEDCPSLGMVGMVESMQLLVPYIPEGMKAQRPIWRDRGMTLKREEDPERRFGGSQKTNLVITGHALSTIASRRGLCCPVVWVTPNGHDSLWGKRAN